MIILKNLQIFIQQNISLKHFQICNPFQQTNITKTQLCNQVKNSEKIYYDVVI